MINKSGIVMISEEGVFAKGFVVVVDGKYRDSSYEILAFAQQKIDEEIKGLNKMYKDLDTQYPRL